MTTTDLHQGQDLPASPRCATCAAPLFVDQGDDGPEVLCPDCTTYAVTPPPTPAVMAAEAAGWADASWRIARHLADQGAQVLAEARDPDSPLAPFLSADAAQRFVDSMEAAALAATQITDVPVGGAFSPQMAALIDCLPDPLRSLFRAAEADALPAA
ncbi:MAG TPA: hypothetical protein VD866_24960 [Urbifossiella sp.]|nr:hypothetical protein [Urbifossiella sp.]